jgi:hypothetical protein
VNRRTILWIPIALGAAVLACGPAASIQPPATSAPPAGQAQPPTTAPAAQATQPAGSDVSTIVACDLASPQEVADLLGGTVYRELDQAPSPSCTYEIDPAGEDTYWSFIVSVEPTDWVEPLMETMPEDLGDPVSGIGDVAYLGLDEASETYNLIALVRGRFGLEIHGDDKDGTLALGRLMMSRLLGP